MLFIKLTGGPFLQGQFFKFAEFWVFRTYIGFSNCEYGVCWTSQVCVVIRYGRMKPKVWAGSVTHR